LDRIINRIVKLHVGRFPDFHTRNKGSRVVYHFNVPGIFPLTLEREHRGRDCVLPKFAKIALNHIETVLDYLENEV